MKRETACELGEVTAHEAQGYPDSALGQADSSILFASQSQESSTNYIELVVPLDAAQPQVQHPPDRSIRLLDLTAAGLILLFVLPLMLFCALAIALSSRGPVIYRQARIGRGGREFICFKFRTMTQSAELSLDSLLAEATPLQEEWASIYKLRSDPRVTFFGRFMRRYSLDELPQLFNVFRGDMSIVGPRPIVADEVHRYGGQFDDYCRVKPGITGLWQVSGRHALSYDERVRLDAEYANHKSLGLDLLILWKTIPVVLLGQNE